MSRGDNDRRENNVADDLVSRLCDGKEFGEFSPGLSSSDKERIAKLLVIDSLLMQKQDGPQTANRLMNLVRESLHRVSESDVTLTSRMSKSPRGHFTGRRTWIATIAAMLLITAVSFLWPTGPKSAYAILEAAQRAAEEPIARAYSYLVKRKGEEPRKGKLYVQGRERYALTHAAPLGEATIGSDGKTAWFVPAVGPVLVRKNPELLEAWVSTLDADAEFLTLTSVLDRIQKYYEVDYSNDKSTAKSEGVLYLEARKKERIQRGPDVIRVEVLATSNYVQKVVMTWNNPVVGKKEQVEIEMLNEGVSPDSFEHRSYHDSRRREVFLP